MTETQTVGFSITGEFITEHARNLWAERSFAKALDLLECLIGSTRDQHESILFGKKKLVGVNDVQLVDDEWTPPAHYCPSFREAIKQGENYGELTALREDAAWDYARAHWHESRSTKDSRNRFWMRLKAMTDSESKAQEINDAVMHEFAESASVFNEQREKAPTPREKIDPLALAMHTMKQRMEIAGMDSSALPPPEVIANRGRGMTPKLDKDMESVSGWLLPDGKFYGCSSMEHIGLAEALLPDAKDAEQEAERRGWVKLSKTVTGFYCLCQQKPTKRQLSRLFDYSERHGRNFNELTEALRK